MRIVGNSYFALTIVGTVIISILSGIYFATYRYNAQKDSEANATTTAFLAGKTLNCINGGSEEDISISRGWQYRDSDDNVRFKKDSTIFLPSQCKEITTK